IPIVLHNMHEFFIPLAAAFAAGNFIYIAGSDLIPELHKKPNAKSSVLQFIMILIGIGIMYTLVHEHH
ncbi:MAG: ZIP family metal transporter, partial [Candidatus Pacebacteria bacterium]|nr:ZIP family metal transporter [Candidatus Paceibacterota bacterium]